MNYPKPQPSAGPLVTGLIALIAGWVLRPYSFGVLALVLLLAGAVLLVVGVGRLASAVDAAALHRWQLAAEEKERTIQSATVRHEQRRADSRPGADEG
jgi:hypothetical protein